MITKKYRRPKWLRPPPLSEFFNLIEIRSYKVCFKWIVQSYWALLAIKNQSHSNETFTLHALAKSFVYIYRANINSQRILINITFFFWTWVIFAKSTIFASFCTYTLNKHASTHAEMCVYEMLLSAKDEGEDAYTKNLVYIFWLNLSPNKIITNMWAHASYMLSLLLEMCICVFVGCVYMYSYYHYIRDVRSYSAGGEVSDCAGLCWMEFIRSRVYVFLYTWGSEVTNEGEMCGRL